MTHTRYSIWLMPPAALRERFAELIDALSRRLGTPRFEPHITLAAPRAVTDAQALSEAQRLATRLAPVPLRFNGIDHTDAYFRCLFLRAVKTPEILAAHRRACAELGEPIEADYMPHLSLVYGEIDRAEKEKMIADVGARFPAEFVADGIAVCSVVGPPDAWPISGPFPLTGV